MQILGSSSPEVSFVSPSDLTALRADVVRSAEEVTAAAERGDVAAALERFESHRLLCAHRDGPAGVKRWARQATEWIGAATGRYLDPERWYPGQPLLVTANDHDMRIYNGDTGVVVRRGDELVAAFARGEEPYLLHPSQLSAVNTVYAMTIHRSQGSQYGTVSVVLPEAKSALLTRELLYTAITRARVHVRVIGTEESVRAGVARQVLRASGLRREIPELVTPGVSPVALRRDGRGALGRDCAFFSTESVARASPATRGVDVDRSFGLDPSDGSEPQSPTAPGARRARRLKAAHTSRSSRR